MMKNVTDHLSTQGKPNPREGLCYFCCQNKSLGLKIGCKQHEKNIYIMKSRVKLDCQILVLKQDFLKPTISS
jgi:hypothetical protein